MSVRAARRYGNNPYGSGDSLLLLLNRRRACRNLCDKKGIE